MRNLITLCFLLFAFVTVTAQKDKQDQATKTILKTLKGQEYYYPVVGEMGWQKIASGELDDTKLFLFKNKDGKKLFQFRVEDSTIEYDKGILIIWHNYRMHKIDISKGKADKLIEAFSTINN